MPNSLLHLACRRLLNRLGLPRSILVERHREIEDVAAEA